MPRLSCVNDPKWDDEVRQEIAIDAVPVAAAVSASITGGATPRHQGTSILYINDKMSGRGASGGRTPSAAWSRLKPVNLDPLEQMGLPSKGDNR